jgi:putative ABC transport system permease protein
MNWRVGQTFTLHSAIRKAALEFRIVEVATDDAWAHNFFFRDDYYQDAVGDNQDVNIMWLSVRDASTANRVAAEVESIFENSTSPLRVETESAGASRLTESTKTISRITMFISIVLFLDMVVVLSNSINLTVRERYQEIAILKVLGFQPRWIITLICGESILIGAVSGLVGASLACALLSLDWSLTISVVAYFPVASSMLLEGPLVGASVGALASLIPAHRACRIPVIDSLVST